MADDKAPEHALITASRVKGAPVFNAEGERLGHVEDLSIDKVSGQVRYALLSSGGIFGLGDKLLPLPWAVLRYDLALNGYIAPLTKEALKTAPAYDAIELEAFGGDHGFRDRVFAYYSVAPYW